MLFLLEKIPVSEEGNTEGICPQSLAALNEYFSGKDSSQGIFYTPWPMALRLVRSTLVQMLVRQTKWDKKSAQTLLSNSTVCPSVSYTKALETDQFLSQITICDPAAGTGNLLVPCAFEIARLRCLLNSDLSFVQALRFILQHNLYATDISESALSDLQLRFAILLFQQGVTPGEAAILPHVFLGNALSSTKRGKSIWKEDFPEVFAKGRGGDSTLFSPTLLT